MKRIRTILLCSFLLFLGYESRAQIFTVGTNAAAYAVLGFNVSLDVAVSPAWSVEAEAAWTPLRTASYSLSCAVFSAEGRRWFTEPFAGRFVAFQALFSVYDAGRRGKEHDGKAFGVGIGYGYSMMLSLRWNVEFEAGAGLAYMKDSRYERTPDFESDVRHTFRRLTLVPTRLSVRFSYLF